MGDKLEFLVPLQFVFYTAFCVEIYVSMSVYFQADPQGIARGSATCWVNTALYNFQTENLSLSCSLFCNQSKV